MPGAAGGGEGSPKKEEEQPAELRAGKEEESSKDGALVPPPGAVPLGQEPALPCSRSYKEMLPPNPSPACLSLLALVLA